MTRLHFNLSHEEDEYRTAASRIHEAISVNINEQPDAIITDDNQAHFNGRPVLLVNAPPLREEPWLFPALPWRFAPDVRAVAESLRSGNLGKPGLLRLHCWASATEAWSDASKAGAVDLARWWFANDPDSVYGASFKTGSKSGALIHLGFPGGGMAMLDFTNALPNGESYRSFSLIGSRGSAYADDHHNRNLFFTGNAPGASPPNFDFAFIQPMLEDFLIKVREGSDSGRATQNYRKAVHIVSVAKSCGTQT